MQAIEPLVVRQNSDLNEIKRMKGAFRCGLSRCSIGVMLCLLTLLPVQVVRFFRSRRDLLLENFALRQQLVLET